MRMRHWLVPGLLLIPLTLPAARPGSGEAAVTLSLAVDRNLADFRFEDGARALVDTDYTRVAIELWTDEVPGLELGLTGGIGWLNQDGDPATEGRSFSGESLGLMLRSAYPLTDALALIARGHWIYHDLSDDADSGREPIELEWYEAHARLGARLALGRWRLGGGLSAGHIDGKRRRADETRPFEAAQTGGGYLQAAVTTGDHGRISLDLEAGSRQAATIRFTRGF